MDSVEKAIWKTIGRDLPKLKREKGSEKTLSRTCKELITNLMDKKRIKLSGKLKKQRSEEANHSYHSKSMETIHKSRFVKIYVQILNHPTGSSLKFFPLIITPIKKYIILNKY